MKKMLKNKKGFTLVELLAVIVILALLIVITANTVLPMMNNSKQSGMVTYAERVLNTASSMYQADSITGGSNDPRDYSIEKLMGEKTYFGCVQVKPTSTGAYAYKINIYDSQNKLALYVGDGSDTQTSVKITPPSGKKVADMFTTVSTFPSSSTYDTDTKCDSSGTTPTFTYLVKSYS